MIEGLQPYSEYKESEQKWLGTIPRHWNVRRTKLILQEIDSRTKTGKEQLLRVSQYTGVTERKTADGSDTPDTRASSLVGYKQVAPQDLVINIMLAWNGSMGVSGFSGIASPAYCVYRFCEGAYPWYFHNLFRTPLYKGRIKAASTGVVESRLRLYSDDLGRIEALLPPPNEQAAIVRFLDHANRKIDGFIRAKRKLIGLLNEQKQAIIHRAVTRGLDPNVKLKDSGIPWLGDIPEHWEVAKFKHFFRVRMGQTFLKPDLTETGELPVLSATMSGSVLGYTTKAKAITLLKEGDLVIPARGNSIGYVALVNRACTSSQTTIQAQRVTNNRLSSSFAHLFGIGNKPFLYSFVQTAIPQITTREVASNPILVPRLSEQNEICAAVGDECSSIVTTIARTEREIALMQEYRTRLTADVVTGKLDVRAAAHKLPDLTDQPQTALDESSDNEEVEEEG